MFELKLRDLSGVPYRDLWGFLKEIYRDMTMTPLSLFRSASLSLCLSLWLSLRELTSLSRLGVYRRPLRADSGGGTGVDLNKPEGLVDLLGFGALGFGVQGLGFRV